MMRKALATLAFSLVLAVGMAGAAMAQDNGSGSNGSGSNGSGDGSGGGTTSTAFSDGSVGSTSLPRTGSDDMAFPIMVGGGLVVAAVGARRLAALRA
jgi:hypothetical protein